jgi:spore germination protein KC
MSRRPALPWPSRVLSGLAALSLLVSLAGCWDNRSLDARGLVLAMGVGPGPHHQITVYLTIPTPTALTTGSSSAGSGSSGGSGPNTYLLEGTGPDIGAAIADAQGTTSRDIYLGQIQLVLFSHRLPPSQFGRAIGWLTREGNVSKTAFAAVAKSPLATVLSYQPAGTTLGPIYFLTLFTCARCQTVTLRQTIWSLEMRSVTPGYSYWLPAVDTRGPNYVVNRIVAYRGNQPVATLPPAATIALGYVLGKTVKGTLAVTTPEGLVGLRSVQGTSAARVTWAKGHMAIAVNLSLMASIDQMPSGDASPSHVAQVERAASQSVARRALHVMQLLQREGSDPEGFGRALFWNHPALAKHWEQLYQHAHLSVTATTVVQNLGDTT